MKYSVPQHQSVLHYILLNIVFLQLRHVAQHLLMVLQLTSIKIAWTNSRTKPFTAPTPGQTQHKVHLKYLGCPANDEHLTFLQWLREYDHDKNPPKRYKDRSTLVGVKHLSPFNPIFFYQLLIMNLPHRTLDELHDLREERLPEPIKHFVPAREKLPHILGSRETILEYLSSESHKGSYLKTIVLYIQSLQDIYALWQLGVIDCTFASSERSQFELQNILSLHSSEPFIPDTFLLWRHADVPSTAHGQLQPVALPRK